MTKERSGNKLGRSLPFLTTTFTITIMSVPLTAEEFSKQLNTKFRIGIEEPIVIELTEVKRYSSQPNEQPGMERFSVFFSGPGDTHLPQATYAIQHEQMGCFDLFLVPIGRDSNHFHYEAVFNYFRDPSNFPVEILP